MRGTSRMNRFFSKLDLRDIKIDPAGSRFPPDADDHDHDSHADIHDGAPEAVDAAPEAIAAADAEEEVRPEPDAAPAPAAPRFEFSYERTTASASFGPATATTTTTTTTASYSVEPAEPPTHANGQHDGGASNGALPPIDAAALLGAEFIDAVGVDDVLKVSARSRPSAVAGAIAGVVRECGRAEVQAIGAGATNQAVKAVAIARDYLRETGIDAVCLPAFIDVTIENEDRTAIRLVVEVR